jgi:hypothetical protein
MSEADQVARAAAPSVRPAHRQPVLTAALGGALWVAYGVLELVQPWGADTRYDEARGYDVVVDRGLHLLYSLPGSLALLLCAAGLLALLRRFEVDSRATRVAIRVTAGLAVLSAAGVLLAFDPVFTTGRVLGTVVLGIGLLAAGRAAGRAAGATAWRSPFVALGLVALFLLPLWPLVFAVQWLSPGAGAAVIGLHGLGWMVLGGAAPSRTVP